MLALRVVLTLRQIGAGLRQLSLRLGKVRRRPDLRGVQVHFGARLLCDSGVETGLSLIARDDVVARIDLEQQITGMDEHVVVDAIFHHVAGHLRGDRYGISLRIGIVRAFLIACHQPKDQACIDRNDRDDDQNDDRLAVLGLLVVLFIPVLILLVILLVFLVLVILVLGSIVRFLTPRVLVFVLVFVDTGDLSTDFSAIVHH